MNADQFRGRIEIAVGRAKELFGTVLHNSTLRHRGRREQISGQARAGYGDAVAAVVRRSH
jgi:uncharacterized protein YjbJ (UPF0337 family)